MPRTALATSRVLAPYVSLDSLVSHWKLDEASGTRNDSHGTNHLTDNNTVTQNPGKLGNAAQFTAANSEYLSIASNASLQMGNIDFTLACWFYCDTSGVTENILAKGNINDNSTNEYILWRNPSNAISFEVSDGVGSAFDAGVASAAVTSLAWHFVLAWHDAVGDTINIQVDDGGVTTLPYSGGVQVAANEFRIGRASTNTAFFFDGRIDSVSIWKRVLTSAERAALYSNGQGLPYPFSRTLASGRALATGRALA